MANDTSIGGASLEFTVDGSQAVAALDQIEDKAVQVDQAAGRAAARLGGIGDRAGDGAQKADRATQSLIRSAQMAVATAEAGERGTAKWFEAIARQKGIANQALDSVVDSLRKAEAAAARLANSTANDSFIDGLQRQAAAVGKTKADLLEMEAAQRGLTSQASPFIAKLREAEKSLHGVGVSAGQTKAALAQLPAQFTDIGTQLAGGANPLLVLIQQGGQIKDSFGGFGNALRGIGAAIKPAYIGIGLVGGAMALLAKAALDGASETKELADALTLTGNAAGQSQGKIDSLVKSLASNGDRSIGTLREVATELVKTGAVGPLAFASATEAAERYAAATGKTAAEVAKDFATMARDPAKWAQEAQRNYGLLTATQYQYVKSLQERGQFEQAQAVVTDALNQRLKGLDGNLGLIDRALKAGKNAWSDWWDAAKGIGKAETAEEALARIQKAAQNASKPLTSSSDVPTARDMFERAQARNAGNPAIQSSGENEVQALARVLRESENATAEALRTAGRKAGTEIIDEFGNARTAVQRLEVQIEEFKEKTRVAKLGIFDPEELASIDAKASAAMKNMVAGAAATQQSVALMTTKIDGGLQAALDASKTQQERLSRQSELGLVSEFALERELAALRLKDNQAQLAALNAREKQAGRLREPEVELAKIENERQALLRENLALRAAEARIITDMVSLGERRQQSPTELFRTSERQADQGIDDGLRQQRLSITTAIQDQARALKDSNAELALEASLFGQSSTARSVALQQLRIQLQLEREMERINGAGFKPEERDQRISDAKANAKNAIDQVANKANVDYLADLLDPTRAKTFGEALTAAFDGAGNSLVKLTNLLQDYSAQQTKLNDAFKLNRDDSGKVKSLADENTLIREQGRLQINTYASIAGAAKGFFDEHSRGYKAMQAAETAFQAFQLASDLVKGISAAAVGVATQAQGDPYTAFPRMAAMAAAMAALGFATGFFGNSGGGSQATAAQRQGGAATGRIVTPDQLDRNSAAYRGGTVLGNDEARSESIAKSIGLLEDHARLELDYSRSQLTALEAIRDSMAGVASLIVRSVGGGLTTGKNFNIQTGVLSKNEGDPILKMAGINDAGVVQGLANSGSVLGKIGVFAQSLWGKVTQKIADSGLEVSGTIADLFVRQFIDVEQTTSSFFGLKKKTTTDTQFAAVEDQLAQQFSLIFAAIGDTVKSSAVVLGREGGDALEKAIASFPVAIERLSLKDLKGDELQSAISSAIGAQADTIAQALVPGLEAFQTVGQGYYETLVRVSSGIELANYQLDLLNISAVAYTDVIRKQGDVGGEIVRQSIALAETAGGALSSVGAIVNTLSGTADELADTYRSLLDVRTALIKVGESGETLTSAMIRGAGGLDKLSGSLETYFTEFFSEQEQLSANANALTAEFGRLGLAVPLSREEFRNLVTTLNDGSDAGAAMAAKVLGLAGAFDQVADAAEKAAGRLTDSISEAAKRFGTPQERQGAAFGGIAKDLQRDAGLQISIGQLIGASRTDIESFARAFIALTSVSDDAKAAVLDAASALADLKDQASSQRSSLEIELLRAQGRELDAVTIERQAEIDQLRNLEGSLGVAAGSFTKLQEEIYAASDAAKVLSGLDNVIADFLKGEDLAKFRAGRIQQTLAGGGITGITIEQIMGATTDQIVELWNSVGDAGKQAILDSYSLLNQLQTDLTKEQSKALQDQLAGMKGLRDLSKDIKQFLSTVKFGDLSPLSAEAQLTEARKLFDTTFSKAQGGDTNAQGQLLSNAQAYLQELQSAFASGPGFTAEFNRVTSMLDALGMQGDALDPQIKYLESLSDNSRDMLDALLSIDSTLKGVPQSIGDRTYVPGQTGSGSGGGGSNGGVVDVTPMQGAEASKQTELLMEQVKQLTAAVVRLDAIVKSNDANALISQQGANKVTDAVNSLRDPLDRLAGTARSASNKAAVMAGR